MKKIFYFMLVIGIFSLSVFGQNTVTLSGNVVDEQGAVIAGASIKLVNTANNLTRQTTTNEDGFFTISLLPPSNYELTVTKSGFSDFARKDLTLNVGDQKSLQVQMTVGGVAATVEVESSLVSDSATAETTINREFVENLPLNGRSFQSLINLTPGVNVVKPDYSSGGQFSVNGQRSNANYFTVDGVSANIGITTGFPLGQSASGSLPGLSAAGGTNSLVSVDALQEFRVLTSTFAPEFGRTPGGQVQMVTRSGTNRFSGTVFNYLRNDIFDANDWFANRQGVERAPLRQNNFGGVFGGRLLRDRTFFFFSYEGLRLRQPQAAVSLVPSTAARAAAIPFLQPFLNAYPLPNGQQFANGTAQFFGSFSNPSQLDATSIRLDHNLSDRFTFFGRYNYAPSSSVQRGAGGTSFNTVTNNKAKITTLTLGSTQIVSKTVSNEFRFNYSRSTGGTFYELDAFGGAIVPRDEQIFPSLLSGKNTNFGFFPATLASLQAGPNAENRLRQVNLVDNFFVTRGTHQIKFGADYRRVTTTGGQSPFLLAYYFFNGIGSPGGQNPSGTVMSAIASEIDVYTNGSVPIRFENFSLYGQDTWKPSSRLTLTYGLRWDVNPAPRGTDETPLYALTSLDTPASINLAPAGTPLYKTRYTNFAPRFGAAFQLRQNAGFETVLRGGIGIFYDMGFGTLGEIATSSPYAAQKFLFDQSLPANPSLLTPPTISLQPPYSGMRADPLLKTPRVYQWNLAVEQSLGANQLFSATYLGATGRDLTRVQRIRAPNARFSGVRALVNAAESDYHALQLQFQRRLSRGFQFLSSYTWSHSIDTASSDATYDAFYLREAPGSLVINQAADRASSDFDVRHSFNFAVGYDIPFSSQNRFAKAVFGGWSLDGIFTARSALPVNLYAGSIVAADGLARGSVRPDLVSGQPLLYQRRKCARRQTF